MNFFDLKIAKNGYTIIELMITIAIIGTLSAMAVASFTAYRYRAMITRAVADIRVLSNEISSYEAYYGFAPASLEDVGKGGHLDPWGNPYQYQNFSIIPKGKWRKDRFLVPINSTYDLWSMGPDGRSVAPLTAKHSRDDIIRANDGAFIGPASRY